MSQFDAQSVVSSRSTSSRFPPSTVATTTLSQSGSSSRGKKEPGFVAPNSRRGGRDFRIVHKQKSDASIATASSAAQKAKGSGKGGGGGFRRALGDLIAGRANAKNAVGVVAAARGNEEDAEELHARAGTPKPRLANQTSEWVQQEARRSQLRERELKRLEADLRSSQSTVESLDDRSFYAYDLQSDSDEFPVPPARLHAASYASLSTFPNLSQISLRDSYLDASLPDRPLSRNSALLTPAPGDPASRRLSSRSSPQLRPLLLPRNLPTDPLPPLPNEPTSVTKSSGFPTISLPATPPASPPIDTSLPLFASPTRSVSSSSTTSESNDRDSLLAPSPTTIRARPSQQHHRQSFLFTPHATTNSLGLAVTSAAPLVVPTSPPESSTAPDWQKKFDTTTRMLAKALSFDLVYLARVSIPPVAEGSACELEVVSSSGMPRPRPRFDPELHLSAVRSTTGVLFDSSQQGGTDREAYKTGLLVPIVSMRKVGYVLCAFTKDGARTVGQRELRWVTKFAEELEGPVVSLASSK